MSRKRTPPKSIVLLSSGLDSTVSLAKACRETKVLLALTFDYGQKAFTQEKNFSRKIAKHFDVPHKIIKLPWLKYITKTSLVNKNKLIPQKLGSVIDVWVPNRNAVFLSVAAAFAESMGADFIITGFNAEEAIDFPDNSPEFVKVFNESLKYSTLGKLKVKSYTQKLTKPKIVKLGIELDVPFHMVYSCYLGRPKMCGKCESCRRLINALEACKKEH